MADLVKTPARRMMRRTSTSQGPVREFLAFLLAGELYGVELTRIGEIVSPPPLTDVPRAPRDVLGVCSVRGLLVTVVDLRRRMRLEERPSTRRARVLLVKSDSGEVIGLYVDEVKQVMRLTDSEIEVASSVLGGEVSELVSAIGRPAGQLLILLDLAAIVAR